MKHLPLRAGLVGFIFLLMSLALPVRAQEFGLSFSYFIPKNGYLSTPVSPFSIRGIGVSLNRFIALETGASLYRMSGLNLKDLPFDSKDPLIGPNFTIFIPAEIVFMLQGDNVEFDIKGGGFFFYGFDNKIQYGNMDRAMREHYNYAILNSDLSFKNSPGFGVHGGVELTFYVTSQVGVVLEVNYLVGQAKFPLEGSYEASDGAGLVTENVDYDDAKIDFTGLEVSLGLIFDSGGGPSRPKQKRRR
jgi:hypothetical protein